MKDEQIVTCTNTTQIGNVILIEYKQGYSTQIMTSMVGDPDYETAKKLQPGNKFVLTTHTVKLTPTPKFEIPQI